MNDTCIYMDASALIKGDIFINRGKHCVIEEISVGTKVSISARQCFTRIKSNKVCELATQIRLPIHDNPNINKMRFTLAA